MVQRTVEWTTVLPKCCPETLDQPPAFQRKKIRGRENWKQSGLKRAELLPYLIPLLSWEARWQDVGRPGLTKTVWLWARGWGRGLQIPVNWSTRKAGQRPTLTCTPLPVLRLKINTVPRPHPPPCTTLPGSANRPWTGWVAESPTPAGFCGLPDIPPAVGCFCTIWEEATLVLRGRRGQQHPELDLKIKKARKGAKHQGPPDLGVRRLLASSLLQLKFFAVFKRNSWLEDSRAVTPTSGAATSTPSISKPTVATNSQQIPLQDRCKTHGR